VEATRAAIATAGISQVDVGAIYLAGGSSRMPVVSTVLHRAFDLAPILVEQPELVVAEGSVRSVAPAPSDASPPPPRAVAVASWRRRRIALLSGLVVLAAAAAVTILPKLSAGGADPSRNALPGATPTPTPTLTATPSPSPTPFTGPGVDPCVLGGRWRLRTSSHTGRIDDADWPYVGGTGTLLTYTAKGTLTYTYPNVAWKVVVKGTTWTQRVNGSATGSVFHKDGVEHTSAIKAKGTNALYRGSERRSSNPLSLTTGRETYTCSGNLLTFVGETSSSEYVRIR
jgi:molecular chaperone DnaK